MNIFNNKYNCIKIPIEFKIMACLRILGRNAYLDDITDHIGIPVETTREIFSKFIEGVATKLVPKVVCFPKGKELEQVMKSYESIGLPGCLGLIALIDQLIALMFLAIDVPIRC